MFKKIRNKVNSAVAAVKATVACKEAERCSIWLLYRWRGYSIGGAYASRKYRRSTILVLVRLRLPCGVVRLLCILVCQ